MRILIVNDDGMHAAALPHLIRWARKLGEVTCVVPKFEQSGKSQAIDFLHPVEIKEVPLSVDIRVWAMDSTPADCVRFGATGLKKDYDLILSGINRGYNLGNDIAYSGTVGAINEGGRLGIPAIALSQNDVPDMNVRMDGPGRADAHDILHAESIVKLVGVDSDGGHAHTGGHDRHPDAMIQAGVALDAADIVHQFGTFQKVLRNEF